MSDAPVAEAAIPPPPRISEQLGLAPAPTMVSGLGAQQAPPSTPALDAPVIEAAPQAPAPQVSGPGTATHPEIRPQEGGDVRRAVAQEWLAAGYSPAAVDGILRRIQVESGFDPHAIGDNGTSFGLYQHHADRAMRLAQWAKQNGANPADPLVQTKFAIAEMNGGDPIAARSRPQLMQEKDPGTAYRLFTSAFERGADAPDSDGIRAEAGVGPHLNYGSFSPEARLLIDRWEQRSEEARKQYQAAISKAGDLHDLARPMIEQWQAEINKPPQNMREAWSTWGGVAGALALLAPAFGRGHMSAAINAAGTMMQAANSADQKAYDQAYQRWRDHLDLGLKAVELTYKEAKDIIDDAKLSYDAQLSQLKTMSEIYGMAKSLDHAGVEAIKDQLAVQKSTRELIDANNASALIRSSVQEKTDKYVAETGQQPSATQRLEWEGEARRSLQPSGFTALQKAQTVALNREAAWEEWEAKNPGKSRDQATTQEKADIENKAQAVAAAATRPVSESQRRAAELDKIIDSDMDAWLKTPEGQAADEKQKTDKRWEFRNKRQQEQAISMARSATGNLSDEQVEILAQQYILGDRSVITSLPRGGPARVQVENAIARKMRGVPDAARQIMMNRVRNVEAETAARTAGRITIQTDLYATEAIQTGNLVKETSKAFSRSDFPKVNQALAAFERNTGDPKIVAFGAAINAFINTYGKMSNPTGTGIHDADKERISKILDTAMSDGQVNAAVDTITREGHIVADAALQTQERVLGMLPGGPAPSAAPGPPAAPAAPSGHATAQPSTDTAPLPPQFQSYADGFGFEDRKRPGGLWVKHGNSLIWTPGAVQVPH